MLCWVLTERKKYSETWIWQSAKGLWKFVRFNEVSLYHGSFSCILLLVEQRQLFVIVRPLSCRGLLYRGSTVITYTDTVFVLQKMVPPRGCAYVVMEHRKEASRGLVVLKNTRMYNNTLKVCSNLFCYIFWSSLSLRMCAVSHWSIFSMHVSDQYLNMPVTCFKLVCRARLSDQIEGGQRGQEKSKEDYVCYMLTPLEGLCHSSPVPFV